MIGSKDDSGKPDITLFPQDALYEALHVLADGASHYGRDNWKHVPFGIRRYCAAVFRHTMAILSGEDIDPKHHTYHAAHIIATGAFLFFFCKRRHNAREAASAARQLRYAAKSLSISHDTDQATYDPMLNPECFECRKQGFPYRSAKPISPTQRACLCASHPSGICCFTIPLREIPS